jgi:nucleoside 2-deoxyribosyltransferase
MSNMTLYLAGPLFTFAERQFNACLAAAIQDRLPEMTLVLPQTFAESISGTPGFIEEMFRFCIASIDTSSAVLAILDGADADSGTCIEIGYALAKNKRIIGLRTDIRASEDRGLNLMVSNACTHLIRASSTSQIIVASLADELVAVIREPA